MTLRRRAYLGETKSKAWREKYDPRYFDDPWKAMSPEDRKEANRLFKAAMKALAHSPIQNKFREELEALLKKYGIGEKTESNIGGEEIKGLSGKRKKAIQLVADMLYARRSGNAKTEQAKYDKLRNWCEKEGLDMANVIDGATKELKKSIAANMGGIV